MSTAKKPTVNARRLLDNLTALAEIGATPEGGVHRVAFSPDDMRARAWVAGRMEQAGIEVHTDAVGNTVGRFPGAEPDLKPIAIGSHTDTVPSGGRYDGALGVLSALEAASALHDAGIRLRHPVEVINFVAEEVGVFGSRVVAGLVSPSRLRQIGWHGRLAVEHLRDAGIDPDRALEAIRPAGSLAAYVELHVEQGGLLERAGLQIGVVEGIVGSRGGTVTFEGEANHAGTTPMALRRDALVMAAPFILDVPETAIEYGIVGTVGILRLQPGASNVIPGRVELSLEIRGMDESVLDVAIAELAVKAEKHGGRLERISGKAAVPCNPQVMETIVAATGSLGLSYQVMPSGAGHDAMSVSSIAGERMGMIFVPSHNGVSHSPVEFTSDEDCVNGARVLLSTLSELDTVLDAE